MYKYPYGNLQQLNLDWFLTEWENFKTEAEETLGGIDGALQAEIDRVEAAMTDLYAARDAAIAARDDARAARSTASEYAISAANSAASSASSAQSSSSSATSAAQRAAAALTSEQNANNSAGDAEAWAVGTRFTVPVPSTTAQYQNNSKWWADKAKEWYDAAEALLESLPEDVTELVNMYETLAPLAEEETLTGDIVTFDSSFAGAPIKQIIVNVEPVQSGTGDPSPENVRPITGWTGAELYREAEYDADSNPTLSVTWEDTAGTVYGGTLTINADMTGMLVADRAMVDLGTLTWYSQLAGHFFYTINLSSTIKAPDSNNDTADIICSALKTVPSNALDVTSGALIGVVTNGNIRCRFNDMPTDPSAFKTAVTGWKLVYALVDPTTYILTASQISGILSTLYGTNIVWADRGSVTVTVGSYVETITTQMATKTPKAILCENEETGATATKNYVVNDFLIWNNQLYRVITTIAQDTTLTVGTNIRKTTITEEITALLNA